MKRQGPARDSGTGMGAGARLSFEPAATGSCGRGQFYSREEQQEIQAQLSKNLGPEYIANRSGPGGSKISYIEGWKAAAVANEVFGFNGIRAISSHTFFLSYRHWQGGVHRLSRQPLIIATFRAGGSILVFLASFE